MKLEPCQMSLANAKLKTQCKAKALWPPVITIDVNEYLFTTTSIMMAKQSKCETI